MTTVEIVTLLMPIIYVVIGIIITAVFVVITPQSYTTYHLGLELFDTTSAVLTTLLWPLMFLILIFVGPGIIITEYVFTPLWKWARTLK